MFRNVIMYGVWMVTIVKILNASGQKIIAMCGHGVFQRYGTFLSNVTF